MSTVVTRRIVHFLTTEDPVALRAWVPDDEPERFATGEGHHLLELYARLRDRGAAASVGPRAPRGTFLVVASLELCAGWSGRVRPRGRVLLGRAASGAGQALVIRGDYPLDVAPPPFVASQVAPTKAAAALGLGSWMPMLPQRGMRPRAHDRDGSVRSLGLMASEHNVPEFVADGSLAAALAPLGIELHVRTQPREWTDFSDLDAVLCARRPGPHDDEAFTRKPATKLTNAWVAGCIPLVFPEVGCTELVRPDVDALVVRSNDDVVAALTRLRDDPTLVAQLEHGGRARAIEFSTEQVLDRWQELLWSTPHPIESRGEAVLDVVRTSAGRAARRVRRSVRRGEGDAAPGA